MAVLVRASSVVVSSVSDHSLTQSLLDGHFLTEALQGVPSLQFFELDGGVLIQELVDGEVPTADLDLDLVSFDLDHDSARAKLVDALRLPHEHNLELLAIGVVVDVLSQLLVRGAVLDRDVDCNAGLKVNDVRFECFNFNLSVAQIRQKFKRGFIRLVNFIFKLGHVIRGMHHVALQSALGCLALTKLCSQHGILLTKHLVVSLEIGDDAIVLSEYFFARLTVCLFNVFVDQDVRFSASVCSGCLMLTCRTGCIVLRGGLAVLQTPVLQSLTIGLLGVIGGLLLFERGAGRTGSCLSH